MKLRIVILFVSVLIFLLPQKGFATVGGPQYIYRISYSPNEKNIYYIRNDESGRGCPPEVRRIDVVSERESVIFSCDDILKEYDQKRHTETIEKFFADLKLLRVANLRENNIEIAVNLPVVTKTSQIHLQGT